MDSKIWAALPELLKGFSISGTIGQFLLETLRSMPGSSSAKQAEDGIAKSIGNDPNQRVSLLTAYRIWQQIDNRAHRSDVGAMIAGRLTPEKAALAGHLFKESRTLREAVQIMVRFPSLAISNIDIKLEERGTDAFFQFMVKPALLHYSVTECYLFICLYWWLRFSGRKCLPITELSLVYHEPPHVELYRQIAPGARLRFHQKTNIIRLDREVFDNVNPNFSDYLRNLLIRHTEDRIKKAGQDRGGLSARVLSRMQENLPETPLSLESAAREFGMSSRTLRRKLQEEGTSFRDLLELVRRDALTSILGDHSLRIEDIAFLLGYSEYSTFSRAFKKWYGIPPSEYFHRNGRKVALDEYKPPEL